MVSEMRCLYCDQLDVVDHAHVGGQHSCGECCSMHGMLTAPEYDDGEYEWVDKCIMAKNLRIAALEASLKAAHGALELARPVLDDILQSLCESYCPPCEVGDKYDYSELQEPELGWITRTEAALDAVEAAISPPEQLMKEEA